MNSVKLTFILSLFIFSSTLAQERKITGRILAADTQKPLKNVNIIILGTTSGTITNHLGFFELTLDASKKTTLVASHIGYKTTQLPVPAEDRFKFAMEKELIRLPQVDLSLYPRTPATQPTPTAADAKPKDDFIVVESGAMFPTGMPGFYDYLGNSLTAELVAVKNREFQIYFTINERGQAVAISTSDSTTLSKTAVYDAFQKMPNWISATQRQNNVPQYFILPIIRRVKLDISSDEVRRFYEFFHPRIKYPAEARRMGIEGQVLIEFQIDNSGKVLTIKPIKDIGARCGDEVIRVISIMPIEITKGLVEKTYSNQFFLPVSFGLEQPFESPELGQTPEGVVLSPIVVTGMGSLAPQIKRKKRD